ncbi:MAG TPA: hypothetical protein VH637_11425 [Streptosporangiaceae bacterium]|jgi:hypothetical protein
MRSKRQRKRSAATILGDFDTVLGRAPRAISPASAWRWRYEIAMAVVTPLTVVFLIRHLGPDWSAADMSTLICGLGSWPAARRALINRAWCIITPHRVRVACAQARIHGRRGTLPIIVRTSLEPFGERVQLWCTAGICAEDFQAARTILRSACWAREVRVQRSIRHAQLVTLEVIRRR